ncbi:extracellular solute-binding protein [Cohnella zeiphila]|uniref:Extracellular solute-binding protein n=1 Tax=Cohnella zeiphila TaxID=2761120 RepID=A0A7X0SGP8_9BACL|nr:extracellular solute-binding protein [Cohnella zeiphila]MBB6729628.1 extracellular solute-binding protein [Cohnella zeiphila]
MQGKRRRSLLAIPLSGALLLAACSDSQPASDTGARSASGRTDVSAVLYGMDLAFPDGLDENHNPYLDFIEQATGLDVDVLLPPEDAYEEKLNVIMASGNAPDLINAVSGVWVDNYARRGDLLPLDDWLRQYGKHLLANIPEELWDRVRYDGRIYAVPSLSETDGTELMYARKDWLDRLGLAPPRTLEQYYEAIKAFAKDDPDGNGIDDTYGLILTEHLGRSSPFFGAFGTQLDQWLERDGKLVYGNVLPETKNALEFLRRLYSEGLMDPQYPLNETATLADKVRSGKVGLYSATWYDTRGAIKDSMDHHPGEEWIALDDPVGPDGLQGVYGNNPIRSYNVVPKGSANPAGAIRMLDFIAGEGYKTLKLGFENDVWTMKDGVMATDFAKHNQQQYRGIYQSLADFDNPALNARRLDSLGPFHLNDNLKRIDEHLMPDAFTGAPTPSMSQYGAKLKDLQDVFDRIVMGLVPLEAFDDYAAQWYANGGAEITREVNDWYRQSKQGTEN